MILESRDRIQVLRELLLQEKASTQEELREELKRLNFDVNQSTISRDLRRLSAIKMTDQEGRTVYRLGVESTPSKVKSLGELIRRVEHNGSLIVIHTDPGSASLVAVHIDTLRSHGVMGTIAGENAIFIAPSSPKRIAGLIKQIQISLQLSLESIEQ